MAAELRYIVLSNGEVETGIQAYRRMNPDFLPAGDITSWTVNDDQTMTIEMDVKGGSTVNHVTFTVDGMLGATVAQTLRTTGVNIGSPADVNAQWDLGIRGIEAVARAGVHYFNTDDELDRMVEAITALTRRG